MATVIVWIVEGTWQACVDAAAQFSPPDADLVLLHVRPSETSATAHRAFSGLLGRGHPDWDPGHLVERAALEAAADLLEAAKGRLGRSARTDARAGVPEHEVVAAAQGASMLVLARDGERDRLGPRSLGRATRFVVDHAPCRVLLVWPDDVPSVDTVPPPPRPPPR